MIDKFKALVLNPPKSILQRRESLQMSLIVVRKVEGSDPMPFVPRNFGRRRTADQCVAKGDLLSFNTRLPERACSGLAVDNVQHGSKNKEARIHALVLQTKVCAI